MTGDIGADKVDSLLYIELSNSSDWPKAQGEFFVIGPRDVITADYTIIMSRTLEVTSYLLPGQTLESFLHLLQCDHYNPFQ